MRRVRYTTYLTDEERSKVKDIVKESGMTQREHLLTLLKIPHQNIPMGRPKKGEGG